MGVCFLPRPAWACLSCFRRELRSLNASVAGGRHAVDAMADIVIDLSRRNWSNEKIAIELGMEPDEVLRMKQINGLAELFSDRDFSEAWEAN